MEETKSDKKTKKQILLTKLPLILAIAAIVLGIIGVMVFVFSGIFPAKYILLILVVIIVLAVLSIVFVLQKKHIRPFRIVSMVISIVLIVAMIFGICYTAMVGDTLKTISKNSKLDTIVESVGDLDAYSQSIDEEVIESGITNEKDTSVEAVRTEVTQKPFIIYLSGMDASGSGSSIKDKGRSDVNMVCAVNPLTKTIMLVTSPRDSYVALNGDEDKMEKLTHCGLYGVDVSMTSFRWQWDYAFDFNYYAKVSFDSIKRLVDAVGGVDIDSDVAFSTGEFTFHKGHNHLNGDAALAYSRERYNVADGDYQRGRDQQKVIEGLLNKMSSPAVLNPATFANVMQIIQENVVTNLTSDDLASLLNLTLEGKWDLQMYDVKGHGDHLVCYTGHKVRWVFIPDQDSLDEALEKIYSVAGK